MIYAIQRTTSTGLMTDLTVEAEGVREALQMARAWALYNGDQNYAVRKATAADLKYSDPTMGNSLMRPLGFGEQDRGVPEAGQPYAPLEKLHPADRADAFAEKLGELQSAHIAKVYYQSFGKPVARVYVFAPGRRIAEVQFSTYYDGNDELTAAAWDNGEYVRRFFPAAKRDKFSMVHLTEAEAIDFVKRVVSG